MKHNSCVQLRLGLKSILNVWFADKGVDSWRRFGAPFRFNWGRNCRKKVTSVFFAVAGRIRAGASGGRALLVHFGNGVHLLGTFSGRRKRVGDIGRFYPASSTDGAGHPPPPWRMLLTQTSAAACLPFIMRVAGLQSIGCLQLWNMADLSCTRTCYHLQF